MTASSSSIVRGLSFRTKLVLGVCGLVFADWCSCVVVRATERKGQHGSALTADVFREASGRAVAHTRAFVLRAPPVVESLAQLADKGLAVDNHDKIAPQLLAVLKPTPASPGPATATKPAPLPGQPEHRKADSASITVTSRTAKPSALNTTYCRTEPGRKSAPTETNYDPRTREFYTKAKQRGRLIWTQPYVFYQSVPGIHLCRTGQGCHRQVARRAYSRFRLTRALGVRRRLEPE